MIMDSLPVLVEITAVVLMENKVSRGAQHLHTISNRWSSLLQEYCCSIQHCLKVDRWSVLKLKNECTTVSWIPNQKGKCKTATVLL